MRSKQFRKYSYRENSILGGALTMKDRYDVVIVGGGPAGFFRSCKYFGEK